MPQVNQTTYSTRKLMYSEPRPCISFILSMWPQIDFFAPETLNAGGNYLRAVAAEPI
jgi:hypothetical protein